VNIARKGGVVTERIFLDQPVRQSLDDYLEEERGEEPGPLFLSRGGRRLSQQAVYAILRRLADQANVRLEAEEQIRISPHLLRHTQLRKIARTKGVEAARRLSGRRSERYIWRYIQSSDEEMEEALTGVWQ
jgi:integrase/recombinase XerD